MPLSAENKLLAALRTAQDALRYYAEEPPRHTYYIVEAKDGTFLSDMADWGTRARKALAVLNMLLPAELPDAHPEWKS